MKEKLNNYRQEEQDRRLGEIEKHISVLNGELGDVRTHLQSLKTDVAWIKKFFWIVATSSIGALLVGLFNLLLGSKMG